jgi:hypothetical protein
MLFHASSGVKPCLSLHMNSLRYELIWCVAHPLILYSLTFTRFQYDSMCCVWIPVCGSTKFTEWLTVAWPATPGTVATWVYALHWSEWTILPGAMCLVIIGNRVAASLDGTISMYQWRADLMCRPSQIPIPHLLGPPTVMLNERFICTS